MALIDQEPKGGNSLIQSLIEDELEINPQEEAEEKIQDPEKEQIEEVTPPVKKETQKEPKAKDQAPKVPEYRMKGKSENKPQSEAPQEEESSEPSEGVMTAEFVKLNGLPRNMIGLPYSELGRSYKNLVSEYTRTRQKFAEFERTGTKHEEKAEAPQERPKTLKDKVKEKFSKLPDPLDEGFNSSLIDAFSELLEEDRAEQETKIFEKAMSKIQPQFQSVQEMARKSAERELMENITSSLPEGVDVMEVIQAFKEANAEDIEDLLPIYEKKPQRFVRDLVNFFNLNFELQDLEEEPPVEAKDPLTERRINLLAQKKAAEALKETKKRRPSDLNSQSRQVTEKRSSLMQDLLDDEEQIFNQMNSY